MVQISKPQMASDAIAIGESSGTIWQRRFPRASYYFVNGMLVLWGAVASDALRTQAEEFLCKNLAAESVVNQLQADDSQE